MKECFRCQETKPLAEFYKHPGTKDGHLGKCKPCTRLDVLKQAHSPEGARRIQIYEKSRANLPHRLELFKKYKAKWPEKVKARRDVHNAVRDGRLIKLPCEMCGETKVEGHHPDHSKPLEVQWLCHTHHKLAEGKIPYEMQINPQI